MIRIENVNYVRLEGYADYQCPRCFSLDVEEWGDWWVESAETETVVWLKQGLECITCGHSFNSAPQKAIVIGKI